MSLSFGAFDFANIGVSGAGIVIDKITDFGRSQMRLTEYPVAGGHGDESYGEFLAGCVASIEGTVYGDTAVAFKAAKDALNLALAPSVDEKALTKDDRILNSKCAVLRFDKLGRYSQDRAMTFRADFKAQSACLFGTTLNSQQIDLPTAEGGRSFPKAYPKSYGTVQVGGSATLNNAGTFPMSPIVRIYGPTDNPTVENYTTGKQVSLALSIADGDYIEIDMAKKTVMLNGTASRFSSLADRDFWDLQPGGNDIRYSAQTVQTGSYIVVDYRDAWL